MSKFWCFLGICYWMLIANGQAQDYTTMYNFINKKIEVDSLSKQTLFLFKLPIEPTEFYGLTALALSKQTGYWKAFSTKEWNSVKQQIKVSRKKGDHRKSYLRKEQSAISDKRFLSLWYFQLSDPIFLEGGTLVGIFTFISTGINTKSISYFELYAKHEATKDWERLVIFLSK